MLTRIHATYLDVELRTAIAGADNEWLLSEGIGLRLYETVSKRNVASYRSAMPASGVKVIEEMDDDELYLEILKELNHN